MQIAEGQLGHEAGYDIELVDGSLKISSKYEGKGGGAQVSVFIKAEYFLDKLAEAVPGKIDDAVIALLKGALK